MTYREKIYIDRADWDIAMCALKVNGFVSEDDTLTDTVVFSNGYEMDIRLFGGYDDCALMDAVLFDENGNEIAERDTYSEYTGMFKIRDDAHGDVYEVVLKIIDPVSEEDCEV